MSQRNQIYSIKFSKYLGSGASLRLFVMLSLFSYSGNFTKFKSLSIYESMCLVSLASVILILIPFILSLKSSNISEEYAHPVYNSLHSNEFKFALIISLSISIPLVVELFFRAIQITNSFRLLCLTVAPNFVTLLILAVPDLILLCYVIESSNLYVLNLMLNIRLILVLWSSFVYIHMYGGKNWSYLGSLLTCIFASGARVLSYYQDFCSNEKIILIIVMLSLILNTLSFVLYLSLFISWFIFLYKETRSKSLTTDQYLCSIYATAGLICWIGIMTSYAFDASPSKWLDWNSDALTSHTLIFTVFYIFIIIFESKAVQREMVQTKVSPDTSKVNLLYHYPILWP